MNFKLFVILVLLVFQSRLVGQSYEYKIEIAGIRIGDLNVSKSFKDSITTYQFQSKVKFWLFGTVHVNHEITTTYKNNQLMTCLSNSLVNGTTYKSSVKWNGTYYDIDAHTYQYDFVGKIFEPIHWSVTRIYFDEPVNQTRIFSENYGVWAETKLLKRGIYEVQVNKSHNKYYFQSGFLYKIVMDNKVKNFTILKK